MLKVTYELLINTVKSYNPTAVDKVQKAYEYAKLKHDGMFRESGEEYISHPLNVAYILAEMHADCDTLCAALLHDVLEDTNTTKEDIIHEFNEEVAKLVDGVTKLSKMNYATKKSLYCANTRKIITSVMDDVRIIIIKLADRLHNMRTLEHKSVFKQKENSIETLEIFVPLAYFIGAYRIKMELEDLSFKYINPEEYAKTCELKTNIEREHQELLYEMYSKISWILQKDDIPHEIKLRTKNIFGIYKKMQEGKDLTKIHDLHALKIMVNKVNECYLALGHIHSLYHPDCEKFKDYICNPKTNSYQSLHTTVIAPEGRLVQAQIRTFDMDKVASFGIMTLWDIYKGSARDVMQKKLKDEFQFVRSLKQIDASFSDDEEFVMQVKSELFTNQIYVMTEDGEHIALPLGATPIDFAYQIHSDIGNHLERAFVNGVEVPLDYKLSNKDVVYVTTNELALPQKKWEECVVTSRARRKMKDFMKRN